MLFLPFVFGCHSASSARFPAPAGPKVRRNVECGADRSRTDDIQLAKLALYHLSYSPNKRSPDSVVGPGGFEPPTSRLSGVRSSQLSYGPKQPDRLRRLPHEAFQRTESLGPWKLNSKPDFENGSSLSLESPPANLPARGLTLGLVAGRPKAPSTLLRKEVIQPQVPLRLPCYDFTPVTCHSLGTCLPCGLAQPLLEQQTPMV